MLFVLRKRHLEAFAQAARESFKDRMFAHIWTTYPAQCEELGEHKTRSRIHRGVDHVALHGIRARCDVAAFIRLTFVIRADCDTSRRTRSAARNLRNKDMRPRERLRALRAAARDHGYSRHSGLGAR
jgi:hypothetical protein